MSHSECYAVSKFPLQINQSITFEFSFNQILWTQVKCSQILYHNVAQMTSNPILCYSLKPCEYSLKKKKKRT